ncbi:erythrocyte membrane protein 1 [Plasmodium falciparum IGH-CR14]|uniref:Erythrocyte membrane protein 1 n=1 Tax=Plasmodium falciparum IGH-CR14 TaxID=580059 RepID=A0A0L1I6K0_PLAFA|nr:erythrocyte membrane protein 1 [Plasmodium falciparum IGH-CR14]
MGSGKGGGTQDAKHVLDEFGQKVYETVKTESNGFKDELKGNLQHATNIIPELIDTTDTCRLVEDYYNKRVNADARGKRYPCANRQTVRFSDEYGGQCTFNRIKDNETNDNACGACAPFRRLHLCDYNLEKMGTKKIDNTHDLLLEVCMAAKYEGDSIKTHYPKYEIQYPGSGSSFTLCTMLARSFADIGDIVRGKDLYLGYDDKEKNRRKQLDDKLIEIFAKIHKEVTRGRTNGTEERYGNDPNFFQLREDWWDANRQEIWKAITCAAKVGDTYFRKTCNDSGTLSHASNKCRCGNGDVSIVPTYFDYVPQYLRWFEEWAEEFCTKRKHKLQNAIKNCLDETKGKYCSGNGYNCKETIRVIEHFVEGDDCHKCSVSCKPFVKWIDNQKLEFEKQKRKYDKEITKADGTKETTIKTSNGPINNLYVGDFYKNLHENYPEVEDFLEKLSKEQICQSEPKVGDKKARSVYFNNHETNETFCRTKYCEPCPWCGVKPGGPPWTENPESTCRNGEIKKIDESNSTEIKLLDKNTSGTSIVDKLGGLCNDSSEPTIQTWKCRFESSQKNYCVLQDENKDNPQKRTIHSFNSLFWHWITEMFEDSIKWRKEHENCINNNNTCKKGCKSKCECFEKWVKRMKEEWKQVLELYDKQPDFKEVFTPYFTLGYLLKEYFTKIKAPYEEVESVQEFIKEMEQIIDENSYNIKATKENNSITKLLKKEEGIATNCLDTHKEKCPKKPPKPSTPGGDRGARSADTPTQRPGPTDTTVDVVSDSDNDEEEEEEEEEVAKPESDGEGATDQEVTPQPAAPAGPPANVCSIVDGILTGEGKLDDACRQKYDGNNSRLGWKCVTPSGNNTTTTGSICVPPRRRRLYVGKLEQWADTMGGNGESGGDNTVVSVEAQTPQAGGGSESTSEGKTTSESSDKDPQVALLKAFVESAAVETFFLWHRYKKENTKDKTAVGVAAPLLALPQQPDSVSVDSDPQSKLEKGEIPTDFLRQMFYTLADYKDILDGKNIVVHLLSGSSGSDKEMVEREKTIKEAIEALFPPSGTISTTSRTPVAKTSGSDPPNSCLTREVFWKNYAKDIWKGMICSLTYKYDENSKKIEKDEQVYKKFFGENTPGKPGTPTGTTGTSNGTYKETYDYEKVKLEDTSGAKPTGSQTTQSSASSDNTPPTLDSFIKRPTYFRYLEEWGETFCRQRTRMLEKIKEGCKVNEDDRRDGKKCSGYGENCKDNLLKDYTNFPDFNCPDCGKHCSSYRKWIEKKKTEYEKQKNAYGEQKKQNCKEGSGKAESDNGFCGRLKTTSSTAKEFLQKLGSCKKDNGESNGNDHEEDKEIFDDEGDTFKHAENCKPCSKFKINCRNGNCKVDTENECTNNKITAENINNSTDDLYMLVSDNSKSGNGFNDLPECKNADIFEGFRKDEWKCGEVCGYNVCKPKNVNGETFEGKANGEKQIIFIRALFKIWLEYFLEDYNKINAKISYCKENGGTNICIKNCADKWIKLKQQEWDKIKKHYLDKNENGDRDIKTFVSNILGALQPQTEVNKAIKPCGNLRAFEDSIHCNGNASAGKEKDAKKDVVVCLLDKLEKEAEKCQNQNETACDTPSTCDKNLTPDVEDDDEEPYEDLLLQETEEKPEEAKKKMMPKICEGVIPKEEVKDKDGCKPAEAPSEESAAADSGKETPVVTPEEKAPASDVAPKPAPPQPAPTPPPSPPPPLPPLKTALVTSTLAWSVGIGFAAFTYFYLKKKTKASVDLLRVLDIHKSDYDIPTKLSPNRYIPYTSGKYRGKRYIYLEGDSGTDSGYTDHYSDITSSSESEYEEFDINDIYVPGSPKYKTLIEVVLEPSKSNGNTPSKGDGNTLGDDMVPTTNTFTDEEWNELKQDFISNMLQNQPKDVPNDYKSGDIPTNTNNTTMSRDNMEEKPFIMFIQDRNLLNGEEYNYDMSTNSGNNNLYSGENNVYGGIDPTSDNRGLTSGKHDSYSGIDLINDSLSGDYDIYDEVLKRKENELFGTNHVKQTSIHSVAKPTRDDPLHNQLELFHKWLDRHRDMCEKWENHHERLAKLKEEWENDTSTSGNTHPSDSNKTLNTDVSIQIHMDNPKPTNEFTNMDTSPDKSTMDTILEDLDKYNEPYYYDMYDDDIYYDVNDHDTSTVDSNAMDVPSKVQIEMDVNTKLVKEKYPIADVWDI